jgi:tripeptide aminopeptidase
MITLTPVAPIATAFNPRGVAERHAVDITALQRNIASIPAPTGQEAARAERVADEWREQGLAPEIDAVGNVVVSLPGFTSLPPLALLAHLDTVFAHVSTPRIEESAGRLIGPGIGDNARGLAVLCRLPVMLRDAGVVLQRPIDLVATVGEEGLGDLRGARHYLESRATRPEAVIALDSPGDERIVHTGLGTRRYRITVTGAGGHSWNAYGVRSALSTLITLAHRIEGMAQPAPSVHRGKGAAITVATLQGGSAINAIPALAVAEIDVRALDERTVQDIENRLHVLVRAADLDQATVRARIERIGHRSAGVTPIRHPLVQAAVAATVACGRTPQLAVGSTDANAAMALGVPAIALGAGGTGGAAHTEQEWFDATDSARGVERVLRLVHALTSAEPAVPG